MNKGKEKAIRELIGSLTVGELLEGDLVQFIQKLEHILNNYELIRVLSRGKD